MIDAEALFIEYRDLLEPREDVPGIVAMGEAAQRLERLGYHAVHHDLATRSSTSERLTPFSGGVELVADEQGRLTLDRTQLKQVRYGQRVETRRYELAVHALGQHSLTEQALRKRMQLSKARTAILLAVVDEFECSSLLQAASPPEDLPFVSGM